MSALKAFIENDAVYEPSRRGKNNLYKLFICRALALLNEGGYMGFITPMAVLSDDQAADIRRKIVEAVNRIMSIEANRGDIARAARSSLDPAAQPYQDLIDRLIYAMASLTSSESTALEERLGQML